MKTHHLNRLLLSAAAMVAASQIHAQTWQTVYNSQFDPALQGNQPAGSADVVTDAQGRIYSVGRGWPVGVINNRALVLVSEDQGNTWNILDAYSHDDLTPRAYYRAFASDVPGHLIAAGQVGDDQNLAWTINESFDGGDTWSQADAEYPFLADYGSTVAGCADVKIHPSGDVYAAGTVQNAYYVVRKRQAGSADFVPVDSLTSSQSAWDIGFYPSNASGGYGSVFVAGDFQGVWTLRRSDDRGAQWTTADSFYSTDSSPSKREWTWGMAQGILVTPPDASGARAIYVSGFAYNTKSRAINWVVRTSADGGNTWAISDNFPCGDNYGQSNVAGIAQDPAGNIYVCGHSFDGSGMRYWLVRKGTPTTQLVKQGRKTISVSTIEWTTSDAWQLAPGQFAQANDVTCDALGNVYVSGRGYDAAGMERWIVRKLPAGQ